jgi:HAD superfamily hydrolase (TIGR01509 family)
MFDRYLREREIKYGETFAEFTHEGDYLTYVDGKPRYEGVQSFLKSRGIDVPFGNADDGVEVESCCGIGNRKNIAFNEILSRDGVKVYPSTVELMERLKQEGIRIGVASSSKNCESVLQAAGLMHFIETRVDGVVSAELNLKGKPAPDIFLLAADNLGVKYHEAVVVEDAISGVQAAKQGNFGMVLGLAREHNTLALWQAGADVVVEDLSKIGFEGIVDWFENGLEADNWSLSYHDYEAEKERSREALLSVGNGYFGTRGAFCEAGINAINYPGTYMAGVYNRLFSKVSGRDIENEDFVNVSNWLPITFKIEDGNWFDVNNTKILNLKRRLDFKTGILFTEMLVEDEHARQTQIFTRRFASMANPHLAGIHYCLQAVNYSAKITIKSSLNGNHINEGVKRYAELDQRHLQPFIEMGEGNIQKLIVKTTQSNIYIAQSARLEVMQGGVASVAEFKHHFENGVVDTCFVKDLVKGSYLGLKKTVWIEQTTEEIHVTNFSNSQAQIGCFEDEMNLSIEEWKSIWEEIDIQIKGDRLTQKMIRLHLYHLISGTSKHNEQIDFGIPARGLTGEAYRGHIFWDELYILPVYFTHFPQVAKSILMYRFRRLDEARKYAKEFGFKGAMFPWQSGCDGREETQKYHFNPLSGDWGDDHSALQRHVSLAIAYNIIQYFHFTNDATFMKEAGMEMLIEIARFWESKTHFDPKSNRYSITKVMGPDEFHEAYPNATEGGLNDNAYTNLMAVWMFNQIEIIGNQISVYDLTDLYEQLQFTQNELLRWKDIAAKMNLVISDEGIIAQYNGYFDLKELDWDFYRAKFGNVHRMDRVLKADGKTPDDYKVAKQADTLMLFYNLSQDEVNQMITSLGYSVPVDYINRNLEYYLQRTSHGSTLSRVVHSYLAQLIGRKELSWSMFQEAVTSDYNDIQGGTTAEGIHTGVMAGTIWIVYAAFAGIDFSGDLLQVNPRIPAHWELLSFAFQFKNTRFKFAFGAGKLAITADQDSELLVCDRTYFLAKDATLIIDL